MQYKVDIDMNHATMLVINSFRIIIPSKKKKGKVIKTMLSIDTANKVCPKINWPFTSFLFDCTFFKSFENKYIDSIITGIVIGNTKPLSIPRAINSEAPTNPITPIKNIRFQKLSLLSLAAIKPVFSAAEFCISKDLLSFSILQNVVKSSMVTFSNYWFKTYSFIISKSHYVLKAIMRFVVVFLLCLQGICNAATPVNNRDA